MKKLILFSVSFVLLANISFAQLQIDKSIDLTSPTPGDARVKGIKAVSDAEDAVSAEVLQSGSLVYAASGGTASAYTLTLPVLITYTTGMEIRFKAHVPNAAGAVTINVNSLGAIPVKKDISANLDAGDIQTNQLITLAYDGTNFQLLSRISDANSGGTVTSVTATAPLTGGTINNSGNIGIAQASASADGYLSAGNFTNFNTAYNSRIASLTTTGSSGAATLSSNTLNVPNYTLSGLGGVPATTTLSINGNTQDLSSNRSWTVGSVTSVSTAAANNGVTATWTNSTTTPALTIGLGAITPSSINTSGTITASNFTGTHSGASSGTNTGDQTLSGLGGVPTSRSITINGNSQNLSTDPTWSVGTVTSIAVTAPLTGGTITGSGTIGIPAASASSNGYLSSANFTNFNTAYTSRIASLTTTGSSGVATLSSNTLNVPNYTLAGLGGAAGAPTITINGSTQTLAASRTWNVGTVTSVSTAAANNGVTATWANGTTTPALTIGLGAITPSSISTTGTISSNGAITSTSGFVGPGAGACYEKWGSYGCASGYTEVLQGRTGGHESYQGDGGTGAGNVVCVSNVPAATSSSTVWGSGGAGGGTYRNRLMRANAAGNGMSKIAPRCAVCCKGGCYTAYGVNTCATGYTAVYTGRTGGIESYDGGEVHAKTLCIDISGNTVVETSWTGYDNRLMRHRENTNDNNGMEQVSNVCAVCCR